MMKSLLIIVMTTAVVYSYDPKRAEIFKINYTGCSEKLNKEIFPFFIESFKCALSKDDRLYDKHDRLIKEEFLRFLEDVIYDDYKFKEALQLLQEYYRHELFDTRYNRKYLRDYNTEESNRHIRHTEKSEETIHHLIIRILSLLVLF